MGDSTPRVCLLLALGALLLVRPARVHAADSPAVPADITAAIDRYRTWVRDQPTRSTEEQVRLFATEHDQARLTYAQYVQMARVLAGQSGQTVRNPPFGPVRFNQAKALADLQRQIAALTPAQRRDRALLLRLRDRAVAARRLPDIPAVSFAYTPRVSVEQRRCKLDGDSGQRSLYAISRALRAARRTVRLDQRPTSIAGVLEALSATDVGRELLRGVDGVQIRPLTPAARRRLEVDGQTQGLVRWPEHTIYIRTDRQMGQVLETLVQELAHLRDATFIREREAIETERKRLAALGPRAPQREIAALAARANRAVFGTERRAWDVEYRWVQEMNRRVPGFATYFAALVLRDQAADLPLTNEQILQMYDLDAAAIRNR